MTPLLVALLTLSTGLGVYVTVAMLRPEWFE